MSREKEMTFLEHLEELRWHIIRAVSAILVFTIVAFIYSSWIFDHIILAFTHTDFVSYKWMCKLGQLTGFEEGLCVTELNFIIQSRQMMGQFTMSITASIVIGLIVAFPYVFWEIWRFIRPGLYEKEQKVTNWIVLSVALLFLTGVLFGYFVLTPISVYFLASYQISDMIQNQFDIVSYVGTVVTLVLGTGLIFQLPIVVFFLTKIGMITPSFLRKYRRHAVVIILFVAAIITPPDPFSQLLITLPLYLLYECSILISVIVFKRGEREAAKE